MHYMVIERFKDARVIYARLRERGRMMPAGLDYVSSWVSADLKVCHQLMRTDDEALFPLWTNEWIELMDFEIIPVRTSAEVVQMMSLS